MKGSLKKVSRKQGYAYRAVIDLPGRDRRQQTKSFWSKKHDEPKEAAEAWLVSMNNRIGNGDIYHDKDIKFSAFVDVWMAQTEGSIQESTAKKRKRHLRNHIKPYFGDRYLSEISSFCVQSFYQKKLNDLSPGSVRSLHTILNLIFKSAVHQGFIEENPAENIKPPTVYQPEFTVYDRSQINQFLMELREWENDREDQINYSLYPFFYTLFHTGLRVGEALGLRPKDIDLSSSSLNVRKSLDKTGGLSLEEPKTESSVRSVALTEENCTVLRQQLDQRERMRLNCHNWNGADTVFVTSTGSMMWPSARPHLYKNG